MIKSKSIPSVKGILLKNKIETKPGYSFDDGDCLEILPYKPVKLTDLAEVFVYSANIFDSDFL